VLFAGGRLALALIAIVTFTGVIEAALTRAIVGDFIAFVLFRALQRIVNLAIAAARYQK